jgi:NAD(P)-dependent dehydrogenase (short-subunit alcohol dehydrogenase family)
VDVPEQRTVVVVPTGRSVSLEHLQPLLEDGARVLVVDDSEGSVRVSHPQVEVYDWADRRRLLGRREHAIPKRNGACRDLGFYLAYRDSDPGDIVVALDDDCVVDDPDFAARVRRALSPLARPLALPAGRHLNILEAYRDVPPALFPRGFPYSARVDHTPFTIAGQTSAAPAFNLGLWRNVFDVNAIDKVRVQEHVHPHARLRYPSVVAAPGSLVSVCSMNMHFRRELVPAAYQLPMHVPVLRHHVIDRYGDIWGGFVLKLLLDVRGDALAIGEPTIHHRKEGSTERNAWQEHLAHLVNDEMIDLLTEAAGELDGTASYLELMAAMGEELARRSGRCSPILRAYLDALLPAWQAWVDALATCGAAPERVLVGDAP